MALNPSFIVRMERKPGAFGDTMNEIRSWLDHSKIHPASFNPVAPANSGVGLRSALTTRVRRVFSSTLFAPQPGFP